MGEQIQLVKPKKKVDPQALLEEALEILSINQKNILINVRDGKALRPMDTQTLLGTIKSLAILKDLQLKSLELEKKTAELEKGFLQNLSDENVKEKILAIADKIRDEKNE